MAESSSSGFRSVRFSCNSHYRRTSGSEVSSLGQSHQPLCVAITVRKYLNQRSHSVKVSVRSLQLNSERRQVVPPGLLFFTNEVAACTQDGQGRSFKLKSKKRARSSSIRPFAVPCDSSASTENEEKPTKVQHPSAASPNAPSESLTEWNATESTTSPVEQLLPASPSDAVSDITNSSFLEDDVVDEKTPTTYSAKRTNFLPQKEKSVSRVEPKTSAVVHSGKMRQTPPSTQAAPTRSWTSTYCGFGQSFDSRTNWKPTTVMSKKELAFADNLWANVRRSEPVKQENETGEASSQVNKIAGQKNTTERSHDDGPVEKESSPNDSFGSTSSLNWGSNVVAELSQDLVKVAPFRASSPFRELGGADSDNDPDSKEVGNGCHMSMKEFKKSWADWEKRDHWRKD